MDMYRTGLLHVTNAARWRRTVTNMWCACRICSTTNTGRLPLEAVTLSCITTVSGLTLSRACTTTVGSCRALTTFRSVQPIRLVPHNLHSLRLWLTRPVSGTTVHPTQSRRRGVTTVPIQYALLRYLNSFCLNRRLHGVV